MGVKPHKPDQPHGLFVRSPLVFASRDNTVESVLDRELQRRDALRARPDYSSARYQCRAYLISTFAPAASTFFLISSASALVTPSLIVLGAPSTSAFASARPRPGTALRTSLITPILFAPISFKITSKVVFSSAAGAAAPPPPPAGAAATATGAAALTPHFSSSCFTSPAISSTLRPLNCSTILSVSAILFSSVRRSRKPPRN